jgi:hypothetical protein
MKNRLNRQTQLGEYGKKLFYTLLLICGKKSVDHCEKIVKDDWRQYMGNFSISNIPPIIISHQSCGI